MPGQYMCSITAEIMTDPVNTVCTRLPALEIALYGSLPSPHTLPTPCDL